MGERHCGGSAQSPASNGQICGAGRPGKAESSSKGKRKIMHPEGLCKATTVLKPNENGKGIDLASRYGETLENRRTDIEDLEVTLEIARGCVHRHAALKVALLEKQAMQMWRIRKRRLVVISAERAVGREGRRLSL